MTISKKTADFSQPFTTLKLLHCLIIAMLITSMQAEATEIFCVSSSEGVVIAADKRKGLAGQPKFFADSESKILAQKDYAIFAWGTPISEGNVLNNGKIVKRNIQIFNATKLAAQLLEACPHKEIGNEAAARWLAEATERNWLDVFSRVPERLKVATIDPVFGVCWLKPNPKKKIIEWISTQVFVDTIEVNRKSHSKYIGGSFSQKSFGTATFGVTSKNTGIINPPKTPALTVSQAIALIRTEFRQTYKRVRENGRALTSSTVDILLLKPDGSHKWLAKEMSVI